jgi:hypothetical protein
MKTSIIARLANLTLTVSGITDVPKSSLANRFDESIQPNSVPLTHPVRNTLITRADNPAVTYYKAACKGQKLLSATLSPHSVAATHVQPIDSPWTGPITQSLTTWGYSIETDNGDPQWRANHFDECELASNHSLKPMCDALGIDSRSTY